MKCLVTLFQYPPHVEHLSAAEWEELMTFCLRSIVFRKSGDNHLSFRSVQDDGNTSSEHSTPSRRRPILTASRTPIGDQGVFHEVITCIKLMTAPPNAPVQRFADKIIRALVEYVKASNPASDPRDAYSAINTIVSRVLFDQSELVRDLLLELLPIIRRSWGTKYGGLKDEMLTTIVLSMSILVDSARLESPPESLSSVIDGLVDTLYSEYTMRREHEILQLDECSFLTRSDCSMNMIGHGPRLGNARSEHNWTLVCVISILALLSQEVAGTPVPTQQTDGEPQKKRRIVSKVDDICRDSFSAAGTKRACSLQCIPFLISGDIGLELRGSLFERLIPSLLDDNGIISSWTLVAIARWVNSSATF